MSAAGQPVPADMPAWTADPVAANDPTWRLGEELQDTRADLRKGNALVQTPDFVVDFILDLTYKRAVEEFGLTGTTLIDPSCGTGNFLTAAFMRLAAGWWAAKPEGDVLTEPERMGLAQIVLAQVSGVDIDPDCTDLARQRLSTLASQYAGIPDGEYPWQIDVACADSLLHGPDSDGYVPGPSHRCGDRDCRQAVEILGHHTYAVVVGNPPYIVAKDPVKNAAYRARYRTCSGNYSLAVPFCELMFGLGHRGDDETPAGIVHTPDRDEAAS
jgi:hypothetical protein